MKYHFKLKEQTAEGKVIFDSATCIFWLATDMPGEDGYHSKLQTQNAADKHITLVPYNTWPVELWIFIYPVEDYSKEDSDMLKELTDAEQDEMMCGSLDEEDLRDYNIFCIEKMFEKNVKRGKI